MERKIERGMNGLNNWLVDRRLDEQTDDWLLDGWLVWLVGWTDGCMDVQMDDCLVDEGWMGGWTDGWIRFSLMNL